MRSVRAALRKPAWDLVLLAVLPVLLHWRSFDVGLFLDDFAILGRVQAWKDGVPGARWWDLYFLGAFDERLRFSGLLPWWTDEGIRLHFFRPLAAATHAVDMLLWPKRAWLMHLHSGLWLSAATLAARSAYLQLCNRRVATVAAAVFAVSYVHAWPVGWISNRNALIAMTFGALAVRAFIRARAEGKLPWLAGVWLTGSLLAAEAGVAFLAYIVAYEVTKGREHADRRAAGLVLLGGVVLVWRVAYSQAGFGALGSGTYIDPLHAPAAFANLAPERLGVLARFLLSPAQAFVELSSSARFVVELTLLALVLPVLRFGARAQHRFWLLGVVLSLVPLVTSIPQARLVGPAVFGFAPLVGGAVVSAWAAGAASGRVLAVVIALPHLVVSPFVASRTVFQASLSEGPQLGSPGLELGRLRGRNLVILDAPNLVIAQEVGAARARAGLSAPAFTWVLSVGDVDLKRRGCCSVVATDPEGLFRERWSALYRGGHVPFSPGDRVKTLGFEASVLAVSADGLATQVEFQLGGPLGSKQYVLARWNGEDFEVVRAKTLSRIDD